MPLLLTGVLPFLAHNHASATAFLTCRSHNFHASVIPEFLSDEERVKSFCEARQQNQIKVNKDSAYTNLYNLFVETPLMQFSPSLVLRQKDRNESIIKPLLETKYFTRTLQRCSVVSGVPLTIDLLQSLSKVRSLIELDSGYYQVDNHHLEIIVNSFPSLETLTIYDAQLLDPSRPGVNISSPSPPTTKTLRNLTMKRIDALFATQFVLNFPYLRKLELRATKKSQELDLLPLTSALPLLTDLLLDGFSLDNIESLNNLVHLSRVRFYRCDVPDLSFLTQENSLLQLTTLCIEPCGLSTSSLASLAHVPNLHVLEVVFSQFDSHCLQYLENMVHLRKLDLSFTDVTGDSRSLKTLMQNVFQLEELNLKCCDDLGNQGAIAGALYSTHSRLRVLNFECCHLVDDDLDGISALKYLENLNLSNNRKLTNEAVVHCGALVKLKNLVLRSCYGINDLSPLKDCLNLESLHVDSCNSLTDDSFRVFSEEPNSFPNLRVLDLARCFWLTEKVFEHLSKNNHLAYQLKELNLKGVSASQNLKSSSPTARNNICQLKGLRRLDLDIFVGASAEELERLTELTQGLKNLEGQ